MRRSIRRGSIARAGVGASILVPAASAATLTWSEVRQQAVEGAQAVPEVREEFHQLWRGALNRTSRCTRPPGTAPPVPPNSFDTDPPTSPPAPPGSEPPFLSPRSPGTEPPPPPIAPL